MLLLEELFEMRNGYVLDFTNLTFSHFFAEAADVDIDDPIYAKGGSLRESGSVAFCGRLMPPPPQRR